MAAKTDCADREIATNSSVNENGVVQANELDESLSPSQETTIGLTFCASNIFLPNRILWKDVWRKGVFVSIVPTLKLVNFVLLWYKKS